MPYEDRNRSQKAVVMTHSVFRFAKPRSGLPKAKARTRRSGNRLLRDVRLGLILKPRFQYYRPYHTGYSARKISVDDELQTDLGRR